MCKRATRSATQSATQLSTSEAVDLVTDHHGDGPGPVVLRDGRMRDLEAGLVATYRGAA